MIRTIILAAASALALTARARAGVDPGRAATLLALTAYVREHCPTMSLDVGAFRAAMPGAGVDLTDPSSGATPIDALTGAASITIAPERRKPSGICELMWKGLGPDGTTPDHLFRSKRAIP